MKNLKSIFVINLVLLCVALLFAGQAFALSISPGSQLYDGTGTSNSQSAIDAFLDATFEPDLNELYKSEVGDGESGSLAASYNTTYESIDPGAATITYTGGPIVSDAYLLVKDGNNEPFWYLFDLTAAGLNWNGTDTLELSDFWPKQGAISHVTLYGHAAPVPEPATMLLLGTGLIGLASFGRKRTLKRK